MLRHRERAWRARNGRQHGISSGGSPPWLVCPETVRSVDTSADAAREVVSPSTEYVTQSPSVPKPPTTFTGRQMFQQCSTLALFC
jgi:hypothetical protein